LHHEPSIVAIRRWNCTSTSALPAKSNLDRRWQGSDRLHRPRRNLLRRQCFTHWRKSTPAHKMPQGKFHALASHGPPNSYGIGQCPNSSFLAFATMKTSCPPHPCTPLFAVLFLQKRRRIGLGSSFLCMMNCRGRAGNI
jgi:hypothetical protein